MTTQYVVRIADTISFVYKRQSHLIHTHIPSDASDDLSDDDDHRSIFSTVADWEAKIVSDQNQMKRSKYFDYHEHVTPCAYL